MLFVIYIDDHSGYIFQKYNIYINTKITMKSLSSYITESLSEASNILEQSMIVEYQVNPDLLKSKWEEAAEMFQALFDANEWNSFISKKSYSYAYYGAENKLVDIMNMCAKEDMLLKFNCEKTFENLSNIAKAYIVKIQNLNTNK